jgi:hypothetical protein
VNAVIGVKRAGLVFYLANWWAFVVAGLLLSLQHTGSSWLSSLPWAFWGTEIAQALAGGEAATAGAWWILMGTVLTLVGVLASLVTSLLWLAARDVQSGAGAKRTKWAANTPHEAGAREAAFSDSAREAAGLVEDPRLRSLIQQLQTRLG